MTEQITFREFEHSGWQAVAEGYHDYFSALTSQTIDPLIEVLMLESDARVLDVATGPGYVANELAGRGARVTAVDFSSEMVNRAKRLYSGIEFVEGDAEALSFVDGTFDAVCMNFGILHLDNPDAAVREAHRVLKSGGRFSFSVWRTPDEAKGFGIMLDAIRKAGNASVPLPPGPPFFKFSDPKESTSLMLGAGFDTVATCVIKMQWNLKSTQSFFDAFYTGTPRTGGLLRAQTEEHLDAIRAELETSLMPYMVNGELQIPMAALIVCGGKK